jgi:hypothetical protein
VIAGMGMGTAVGLRGAGKGRSADSIGHRRIRYGMSIRSDQLRGLKGTLALFEQMYSQAGRPSIPPERLLKVSLRCPYTPCAAIEHFACSWITSLCSAGFWTLKWDEPGLDYVRARHCSVTNARRVRRIAVFR